MADLQQLVAEQRQLEEELDIQQMVAEQKRLEEEADAQRGKQLPMEEDKVDTNPTGCDAPTLAKAVMATPNRGPVFVLDSTYKAVNKYKLADSAARSRRCGTAASARRLGARHRRRLRRNCRRARTRRASRRAVCRLLY